MLARAAMASNFPLAILKEIDDVDLQTKLGHLCQQIRGDSSIVASSPAENYWSLHHILR